MTTADVAAQKKSLREEAFARRKAVENKDGFSRSILLRFLELPAYITAKTILFYVDARSEVRTRFDLPAAINSDKSIVVPWCNDAGELELFRLESMEELEIGMYNILEPRANLRTNREKQVPVDSLDVIMVPGVAFDERGGRLGHGKGYYDKLLQNARPDCPLVALAYECQIFPEVPMDVHDIFMDAVLTEKRTIEGQGRNVTRAFDFEAEIYLYKADEGGRKSRFLSGIRPTFDFHLPDGMMNCGELHLLDRDVAEPGETIQTAVWLARPELNAGRFILNKLFYILDGVRVIGAGRITRILNPVLQRSQAHS